MTAQTHTPGATGSLDRRLTALRAASRRLADRVNGLDERELSRPSMAEGWSIAQVLSHLGSAAEISTGLLERGIAGDRTGPQREAIVPVWQRWDALSGPAQRSGHGRHWRQGPRSRSVDLRQPPLLSV